MNELQVSDGGAFRTVLEHGDWWPPGHIIGWGDTFTTNTSTCCARSPAKARGAARRDVRGRLPLRARLRRDPPLVAGRQKGDGLMQRAERRSLGHPLDGEHQPARARGRAARRRRRGRRGRQPRRARAEAYARRAFDPARARLVRRPARGRPDRSASTSRFRTRSITNGRSAHSRRGSTFSARSRTRVMQTR